MTYLNIRSNPFAAQLYDAMRTKPLFSPWLREHIDGNALQAMLNSLDSFEMQSPVSRAR